ncbi:serine protease [Leuconostoc falkenbergense]|uniref:SDH family Clp fold serine proteinase n=1 Tax=Leuconostoc falkenbergense TaxID=2766470 RepID=UPI0024AD093C|nr:serine protease [Leuconostoc falkenbergense]MDI6667043.1 serine protease [Leuconostoc falkenbergense]
MANYEEIARELGQTPTNIDYMRNHYANKISEITGRDIIYYYSGWMQNKNSNNLDINDSDMEGFMNAMSGKRKDGVDLILHTPGGDPNAAESIVKYIKAMYNKDLRVIVPHMAMSAGTMIACASKEIIMGKQSSLGPVDPQFNGIPAYNIKAEFEEARQDLSTNPQNANYWAIRLQQYPAAFLKNAVDAIGLTNALVENWLADNMLSNESDPETKSKEITASLNNHEDTMAHARHFSIDKCQKLGLKIVPLENEQAIQDAVLSFHHVMMIAFQNTPAAKIIGNEIKAYISMANS